MYYIYNDRESQISDPYTIPGNIQYIPNRKKTPESIMKRTKKQMFSSRRTPVHDLKSSHYYKDTSSVRTSKELYRALKNLGAQPTQQEAAILFRQYQDNLGGFDFRRFGDSLVLNDMDRRKTRHLNRILVPDSRSTNVYAVRSLPQNEHQTQDQKFLSHAARTRSRALSQSLDSDHPMSRKEKSALHGGEVDSKTTFPHSIGNARSLMHEYRQLYPRLHSDLRVKSYQDPLNTRDHHALQQHVADRPRPQTTITGTRVAPTGSLLQRPYSAANAKQTHIHQPFARSANFKTINLNGARAHPKAVSRGLWSHSPEPEAQNRIIKHHPTSHKLSQLHHLAYRPMIRAAPMGH
jgi:hypothetical protein